MSNLYFEYRISLLLKLLLIQELLCSFIFWGLYV